MKTNRPARRPPRTLQRAQRGVVMLVALLAMVIMLVGAVALLQSFTTSMNVTGNAAIKRDLANQAERAMAAAMQLLDAGALSTEVAREANSPATNYSAAMLPTNVQGIPLALLNETAFAAVGQASNDIMVTEQGVRVRWVMDRLCTGGGSLVALGAAGCAVGPTPDARGGSASDPVVATQQPQVLYRVSIRVDGPRRTQAFFQSTLAL
jgi:type IV pilus assembly protein PilX